jgi:hypothetical protein
MLGHLHNPQSGGSQNVSWRWIVIQREQKCKLQLILAKQDEQGRWTLEHDGNWQGQGLVTVEKVGQPSKWITLRALRVLKRAVAGGTVPLSRPHPLAPSSDLRRGGK